MAMLFGNGGQFRPDKYELLGVLLYLKGVFSQDSFELFEADYERRQALVDSFEKPYMYMDLLSEDKSYPDFDAMDSRIGSMPFSECAQYMMFYLRLAKRQAGGDTFISMWKNGSVSELVSRMLSQLDNCGL